MMSGAVFPAVWVASLSQYVLNSPGWVEIFTLGLALRYAATSAWVFLLRTGLPQNASARLPEPELPPPPCELPPEDPGAHPASPEVVAPPIARPAAPIRNRRRFTAISCALHWVTKALSADRRPCSPPCQWAAGAPAEALEPRSRALDGDISWRSDVRVSSLLCPIARPSSWTLAPPAVRGPSGGVALPPTACG